MRKTEIQFCKYYIYLPVFVCVCVCVCVCVYIYIYYTPCYGGSKYVSVKKQHKTIHAFSLFHMNMLSCYLPHILLCVIKN